MSPAWTDADLAANGFTRDGKRVYVPEPAAPVRKRRNRQPEQALQTAIVSCWRPKLVPGARLFSTNGELPGGAEQIRRAARRKAMGYTLGTPDLCARRPGYLLWLEVKCPGNYPTAEQDNWASWATDCADGWAVVQSVDDAGAVLKAWGMVA
jgi:hypothetical protein